jgi:hypothetical protein
MVDHARETYLIVQGARWAAAASDVIREAGGSAEQVIGKFPDELINIMVRNSINLKRTRKCDFS